MALDVRGKTVVLTGTFNKLKRAEAEAQLKALGAVIGSGVGKKTHVLFAGEKAGSKIEAAAKLGVTVLCEDDLMAVLRGETGATGPSKSGFAALDGSQAADVLVAAIEALPWGSFEALRDLVPLREALYVHEAEHGVTAAHRAATSKIRPLASLGHGHGHDVEVEWSDLSPDGKYLATGSWTGDDYALGGVLQIWDVRAGRCVNMLRISGGVGWPDYGPCIQWRPDGKRVGLTFDTNGVGSFDPFARTGAPESCSYITDGWSRPPAWAWSPNSRDVYIACWGPDLALGAIVPLVGHNPQPRWCQKIEEQDTGRGYAEPRLQPLKIVSWNNPDRVVGVSGWNQAFALEASTGELLWDGQAHPPVSFSPDGEEFAMHPAGIVYYDTKTGLPNGKLPMHLGAGSFEWSRDGVRMAALVQPGNQWGADAGVFVYARGKYLCSVDAPEPRTNGTYAAAWSPDGTKLAVTSRGRLQIWEIGETPVQRLDVAAPGTGVMYGDGVLVAWGAFGLTFVREADGVVIGTFKLAVEASGASPVDDYKDSLFGPSFPLDETRVAAALSEGVVIGPEGEPASAAEIDAKIAWVIDRRWAWPWRWGDTKVWPDASAACADKAVPAGFKRKFGKKAPARPVKSGVWPPAGGTIDGIAELLERGIKDIRDGFHGNDYRRKYAVRTMALGMFERAGVAIDGGPGWAEWDPWFSAYARGEVVVTALAWRTDGAPALTTEQQDTLRRWLDEGEAALKKVKKNSGNSKCRPLVMLGAGRVLVGDVKVGEKLLADAVKVIEPENNQSEHRAPVAVAFAALGRMREAADHLTGGGGVSWVESPNAIVAVARRGSAADLEYLYEKMKGLEAHSEFALLGRGLERLIALKEWDAAKAWPGKFAQLSVRDATARLAAGLAAAGEERRFAAIFAKPGGAEGKGEALLAAAREAPALAGRHVEGAVARAKEWLAGGQSDFLRPLGSAAARLGRLDLAAALERAANREEHKHAVRCGVLAELEPERTEWQEWFVRARKAWVGSGDELAAFAARGKVADAGALLDEAIARAREASSADLALEALSGRMAAAGDLAGAHRAWLAIVKGTRSYRVGPLLAACVEAKAWAAALELLAAMPQDLNGGPQKASRILHQLAGGEGF